MAMFAALALALVRPLGDAARRRLVDAVFVRSRGALDAACRDPRGAQEARLRRILSDNASTEIGQRHGFGAIGGLDAYRQAVPIIDWDAASPLVDRMVRGERGLLVADDPIFYATTSGTTGRRKLIPVTAAFVAECRVHNKLLYHATLSAFPGLLSGKRLSLRSPRTEELRAGVVAGSITLALGGGFTQDEEGAFDAVPLPVFSVDAFAVRYHLALRFAAQEAVAVCSAVNPSTLLLFARTLAERGPALADALDAGTLGLDDDERATLGSAAAATLDARAHVDHAAAERIRQSVAQHGRARMQDVFTGLRGLVCWKGGSAPWYLDRLVESYGAQPTLDWGYVASEGCFAAALSPNAAGSVMLPHGHVIELADPNRIDDVMAGRMPTILLDEAEVGREYEVIVTNGAGLYRYRMHDVVRVVGHRDRAPEIVFLHKAGAMISITGEKVGESHVVTAMAVAARPEGSALHGFVLAPVLPADEGAPHYLLAVDGGDDPWDDARRDALAARFDEALRTGNEEYDAKRASLRLGPVRAAPLPAHAIRDLRARRVRDGAPDAHVKLLHVSVDGRLLLDLGLERTAPLWARRVARGQGA